MGNAEGKCFCSRFLCTLQRSWLTVLSSRSKPSQLSLPVWSLKRSSPSQLSQGLPEPAHSTGSHSKWRMTHRRLTPSQPPLCRQRQGHSQRDKSSIDRLTVKRPSVSCFTNTDRVSSFISNFTETAANEHFRGPQGVDKFGITSVEADAEGICSVHGSCPNQDLMIVNRRTRHLHG